MQTQEEINAETIASISKNYSTFDKNLSLTKENYLGTNKE